MYGSRGSSCSPNPILVAFRDAVESGSDDARTVAREWPLEEFLEANDGAFTSRQVRHAVKVILRVEWM